VHNNLPFLYECTSCSVRGQGSRYCDTLRAAQLRNRVSFPPGTTDFSTPTTPGRLWGPPILLFDDYRENFRREAKRPGREDNYLSPFIS